MAPKAKSIVYDPFGPLSAQYIRDQTKSVRKIYTFTSNPKNTVFCEHCQKHVEIPKHLKKTINKGWKCSTCRTNKEQ